MSNFVLLSLFSLALGATVLEGRSILLENGKTLYLRSVDSSELPHIEAIVGCSTKCASACLSFSTGQASVQCAKHCGCASLISSKPEVLGTKLYEPDISVDVFYPGSSSTNTEIFAEVEDEDVRITVSSNHDSYGTYNQAYINTEDGDPSQDEVVVYEYVYADNTTQAVSVEASTPSGEYVGASVYNYNSGVDENGTTYAYQYAGVTTVDSYGNSSTQYAESSQVSVTDGETTVIVSNTTVNTDTYYFEEGEVTVVVANSTDGTAEGYTVSGFYWVNTQAITDSLFSFTGLISICLLSIVLYLIKEKYSKEVVKHYHSSISPVEHPVNYIRI